MGNLYTLARWLGAHAEGEGAYLARSALSSLSRVTWALTAPSLHLRSDSLRSCRRRRRSASFRACRCVGARGGGCHPHCSPRARSSLRHLGLGELLLDEGWIEG